VGEDEDPHGPVAQETTQRQGSHDARQRVRSHGDPDKHADVAGWGKQHPQPGDTHCTHPIAQGRDPQAEQQAAGLRVAQKPPVHRRDQAPSLLRSRHQGTALSLCKR
jgi:hypothetical protein